MKRKVETEEPSVTFALMWLCAQPKVAKQIRKLGNPLPAMARQHAQKGKR